MSERRLQTDMDSFKKGEYEGFKVGDIVRWKDQAWYEFEEPFDMVIIEILTDNVAGIALLKRRDEIGVKRHSFFASINVENIIKVKDNEQ